MKCKICGYVWKKRFVTYPRVCAKCKSTLWDVGHNVKCSICNRLVFTPYIHHINGNHKDNRPKNRIVICLDCHTAIHRGIGAKIHRKGKRRNYTHHYNPNFDSNIIKRLEEFRNK